MAVAVGLDFDHTLGLDNGLETTAFYRFAAELGHSLSERDPTWKNAIANALDRFRAGAIPLDAAVADFVVRLGRTPTTESAERYRQICYALVDDLVTPIDGARELIATLAERNIPTAILTNGWSPLQHHKIARAIAYAGPVLVSDELGVLKPAAAAFAKLVDVLGAPCGDIWFVGDNPATDIAGAQNAGLHGVWFDWEHIAYPADAPRPSARIEHLRELLDLLPGSVSSTEKTHR